MNFILYPLGKRCSKCGRFRFFEFFSKSSKTKDRHQAWCKSCIKDYDAIRYENPEERLRLREKAKETSKRNKAFIDSILELSSCIDCGESDRIVLEFDHVRGRKLFNISDARTAGYSLATIVQEIDKCEVRCANCHRIKTRRSKH